MLSARPFAERVPAVLGEKLAGVHGLRPYHERKSASANARLGG